MTIIQLLFLIIDGRESIEEQGPGGCQEAVTIVNRDDSHLHHVEVGNWRDTACSLPLTPLSIPFLLSTYFPFPLDQLVSAYLGPHSISCLFQPSFLSYFTSSSVVSCPYSSPVFFFFFISFVSDFPLLSGTHHYFSFMQALHRLPYSYSLMRLIFYPFEEANEGSSLF